MVAVFAALTLIIPLTWSAMRSTPAGAATNSLSGTASVALGISDTNIGVPQTASFTGTRDDTTGAININVADASMDLSLPIGADTIDVSGSFSNPGGFSGTVDGDRIAVMGTAEFTLTSLTIPGISTPIPIGLLGCQLDFAPQFSGTVGTGNVIDLSATNIAIPSLPMLCALGLNPALGQALGTDVDINSLLALVPPASATLSLDLDAPLPAPTSPATTASPSSTVAPRATLAPSTTVPPATTVAPATTTPPTTANPTITGPPDQTTVPAARPGASVQAHAADSRSVTPSYTG